jgi:hypothetical protein
MDTARFPGREHSGQYAGFSPQTQQLFGPTVNNVTIAESLSNTFSVLLAPNYRAASELTFPFRRQIGILVPPENGI